MFFPNQDIMHVSGSRVCSSVRRAN